MYEQGMKILQVRRARQKSLYHDDIRAMPIARRYFTESTTR